MSKEKPQVISVTISEGPMFKRIKCHQLDFKLGPNLIIGPNGSGKSSLFNLLTKPSKEDKETVKVKSVAGTYYALDFEKDNPRKASYIDNGFQIASMFVSHGESNQAIVKMIAKSDAKDCMIFMDEPEQALDMEGIQILLESVRNSPASQIIIATHHPALIMNDVFHVVELEEGYRKKVVDYIKSLAERI
jgi:predicted ATPase